MRYYDLQNPTFEQWKKRGVYVAQCATTRKAHELCGIDPNLNIVTTRSSVLDTFHALPKYRDPYAKLLRDMVALSIRVDRFNARHGKGTK